MLVRVSNERWGVGAESLETIPVDVFLDEVHLAEVDVGHAKQHWNGVVGDVVDERDNDALSVVLDVENKKLFKHEIVRSRTKISIASFFMLFVLEFNCC